jgi:hypothetical protein
MEAEYQFYKDVLHDNHTCLRDFALDGEKKYFSWDPIGTDITTYTNRTLSVLHSLGHKTSCVQSMEFTPTIREAIDVQQNVEILTASGNRMTANARDRIIKSLKEHRGVAQSSKGAATALRAISL